MTTRIAWFVLFLVALFANLWWADQAYSDGGGYLHFALLFALPMVSYQSALKTVRR